MASNTYGAIKLSTAEDVGAVLKKKTGSADGYKPKEWADTINLMGLLPIRTASGTIAHFSDGADDVPMKSVVANIVPIQEGSGTPSPSNPRPISGTSVLNVEQRGANVWDEETLNGYYDRNNSGAFVPNNSYLCSKNMIAVKPSTSYFWAIDYNATFSGRVLYYDENGVYLSASESNAPKHSFTTPSGCYFIHWYFFIPTGYTFNNDVAINYPSTDTSYHAYTGSTYTIALGQTVYGGTADVVGGVGSKTMAYYDFTNKDTSWDSGAPNEAGFIRFVRNIADKATGYNLLCDKFPTKIGIVPASPTEEAISGYINNTLIYIAVSTSRLSGDLTTSTGRRQAFNDWIDANGLEICYELATPTDFTFTGQPINSLLGVNNVWADSGEVLDVEYRADMNLLISELGG